MNWKKLLTYRWILLGLGLVSLVGLTGMNVYSLYALHENTISSSFEKQKTQINDLANESRYRLTSPLRDRFNLNMPNLQEAVLSDSELPENFYTLVSKAYEDSIFTEVYFSDAECKACDGDGPIQKYNPETKKMEWVSEVPDAVKDGIGMSRTRMRVLISEYQFNTRVFFDTHRSLTIAMVNTHTQEVVGYLLVLIDEDYLINQHLSPLITSTFPPTNKSGITVWLHDWTKNEVLATNDPEVPYQRRIEDINQSFPEMLNNWNIKAAFAQSPMVAASQASLYRNLFVLAIAVILLIGALVFMFFTAQKERELAVRQAGFLANVTHELKTPLAVMQAAGENLADGRVKNEERLRTYGKHIYDESMRLRRMIEKLLDVAKSDAGQTMTKPVLADLNQLTEKFVNENESFIKDQGFELSFAPSSEPAMVMIDQDNYETILGNLIENALKYSFKDKSIDISIAKKGKNVHVDVEDHGAGIPRESQKFIFDKFYRVEDANTAKTKGHGLGLSIVKDLVSNNGGEIKVKSTYRKGSTFSLHFPVFFESENGATAHTKHVANEVENVI